MRAVSIAFVLSVACTRSGSDSPKPSPTNASRGDDGEEAGAEPFARNDEEAVRKAVEKATGRDPGEEACFVWPTSFQRVVTVGSFAHDYGCMHDGLFVDRKWYEDGGTQAGLATVGWADADIETRQKLAKAWVTEVSQAFGGGFVDEPTTAFTFDDTPDFEPVRVRATKVSGVVVSGWVGEPSGMVWEDGYRFVEYRFGPDGSIQSEASRRFSVDGQRIQDAEKAASADASVHD